MCKLPPKEMTAELPPLSVKLALTILLRQLEAYISHTYLIKTFQPITVVYYQVAHGPNLLIVLIQ